MNVDFLDSDAGGKMHPTLSGSRAVGSVGHVGPKVAEVKEHVVCW